MIITLAVATILVGKPIQFQPSQSTQSEVVAEQQIIQPSTEVYIEEIDIVNTLNTKVDTTEVVIPKVEDVNRNDNNGWLPIEWDAIEVIEEEDDVIEKKEQYMVY